VVITCDWQATLPVHLTLRSGIEPDVSMYVAKVNFHMSALTYTCRGKTHWLWATQQSAPVIQEKNHFPFSSDFESVFA